MSDRSIIFSHGDLLKTKLARTRGENFIHAVPPDLSPDPNGLKDH